MLFNSYIFLFAFLPVSLAVFFLLGRIQRTWATFWLSLCSLFFYSYWDVHSLPKILISIVFNFMIGGLILRARSVRASYMLLGLGVGANLLALAYYKYGQFFLSNVAAVFSQEISMEPVTLPLGISFFTFTQIAYLVDTYRGKANEASPTNYLLFVTYFPHLIAGPILHHSEMMPQFADKRVFRFSFENLAVGLTALSLGLFKKVILADSIASYVAPVFDATLAGQPVTFFEAWGGALAYTLQIYFDFSGYCDMAVGISKCFGILLPVNFNSPYKAQSIIHFWRCWHMTLSRFLRDYLYISMGGNRCGFLRRYLNLFLTMLLGGLWHGAAWTFIIWGALHGFYLIFNHFWNWTMLGQRFFIRAVASLLSLPLTLLSVIVAWVYFRAESVASANALLTAMSGVQGVVMHDGVVPAWAQSLFTEAGVQFAKASPLLNSQLLYLVLGLFCIVFLLPNTQQVLSRYKPVLENNKTSPPWSRLFLWSPSLLWLLLIAALNLVSLFFIVQGKHVSKFLYFNF